MDWQKTPPLAALRAFAAFAQTGGVQEAGALLNVSHAAISQHLRGLEAHLGVALLNRSARALTLTDAGQQLADGVTDGFEQIGQSLEKVTGWEDAKPVHISTTSSFAGHWLMPRLASFRSDHPNVDLMIDPNPRVVSVGIGGVDVAIRYGDGTWAGYDTHLLAKGGILVVAAPHLFDKKLPETLQDLGDVPWFQELGRHEGSNWLEAHDVVPKKGLTQLPGDMMVEAARAGQGVAVVAHTAVEADLAAGRLVCLFEEDADKGYWLVTAPGPQRSAVKAFIRWIKRTVHTET